jgi:hypothetical protein
MVFVKILQNNPMKLIVISCVVILLSSCKKDSVYWVNGSVSPDSKYKYYAGEIFNPSNTLIYGKWKHTHTFSGSGFVPAKFNFFEVLQFGRYQTIRNDSIIVQGKLIINSQPVDTINSTRNLQLTFNPDQNSFNAFGTTDLFYVNIRNSDTLDVSSGNPDDVIYYFIRNK